MNAEGSADRDGFTLTRAPEDVVDVLFDGRRVFSVAPKDFTPAERGVRATWPRRLQAFLDGRTDLVVRTHVSGEVLLECPVSFGDSDRRIEVVNARGKPLTVDKFGGLGRSFADTAPSEAKFLAEHVARLVREVNDFGVTCFVAFGSLLGAVRTGKVIGHDTDADIAYVSRHDNPTDVALESFALERFLLDRGWGIERLRTGLIRAEFTDEAGVEQHIDIFTGVYVGTHLMIDRFVWAELPWSALVPLGSVSLEGVTIQAPHDPGALLEATYGPTYMVPDPSFSYGHTRVHNRAAYAWFGHSRWRRGAWRRRLRELATRPGSAGPSDLARAVAAGSPPDGTVVDVGCGNARDARWLASSGRRVVGIDYTLLEEPEDVPASLDLRRVSLYDTWQTLTTAARLATEPGDVFVLARDVVDVLKLEGRANFWLLCRTTLRHRGRLYLEFRNRDWAGDDRDPGFRRLDADRLVEEAAGYGARVLSRTDLGGRTTAVLAWTADGPDTPLDG